MIETVTMTFMKYCLVITFVCVLANSASAAYVITVTGSPSTESGYMTYTLVITPTGIITSAEGDFSAPVMRQLNPSSLPTIFEDANGDIIGDGGAVDSDSQFEFHVANDNLLVSSSTESTTNLNAGFTGFTPLSSPFNLAHVVLPDGTSGAYTITMIEDGQEITQTGTISLMPGDADGNGYVDEFDLGLLLANWKTGSLWAEGNFDGDTDVDHFDLGVLLTNWTAASPEEPPELPALVPEPATLCILLLSLAGLAVTRSKGRRIIEHRVGSVESFESDVSSERKRV